MVFVEVVWVDPHPHVHGVKGGNSPLDLVDPSGVNQVVAYSKESKVDRDQERKDWTSFSCHIVPVEKVATSGTDLRPNRAGRG